MEVIGGKQRREDCSFFRLHWEEETARRWELQEEEAAFEGTGGGVNCVRGRHQTRGAVIDEEL